MTQSAERTVHLIGQYLLDELTLEENIELDLWIGLLPENKSLFERLTDLELLAEKMNEFLAINKRLSLLPEPVLHQKAIS